MGEVLSWGEERMGESEAAAYTKVVIGWRDHLFRYIARCAILRVYFIWERIVIMKVSIF
jgi:hypothetical protein